MTKKVAWSLVAVLVVVAGAGSIYAIKAPQESSVRIIQADNTVAGGLVSAASPSSVTITKQDNTSVTFGITSSTKITSQVAAGQTGKGVADLLVGTMILVTPSTDSPLDAAAISFVPIPSAPVFSAGGPFVSVSGTVTAKNATSLTVKGLDNSTNVVLLDKDTQILSTVTEGEKGKTVSNITVGSYIQSSGISGAGDLKAQSVVFMAPANI